MYIKSESVIHTQANIRESLEFIMNIVFHQKFDGAVCFVSSLWQAAARVKEGHGRLD